MTTPLDLPALRALCDAATAADCDGQPLIAATGRMHLVGPPVEGAAYDAKCAQIRADAALWNAARSAIPDLCAEIERLGEYIAASKECSEAGAMVALDTENQRLLATFKRVVDDVEAGNGFRFSLSGCEWCHEKWPKLDDQTIAETEQKARVHVYGCKAHPMRAEIDSLRFSLTTMTVERDEARSKVDDLYAAIEAGDDFRDKIEAYTTQAQLRAERDTAIRERNEARAEVERLREAAEYTTDETAELIAQFVQRDAESNHDDHTPSWTALKNVVRWIRDGHWRKEQGK